MSYLDDLVYYGSGTECPKPYLYWSALSLLGAVAGRKYWVDHGKDYFKIFPNLYVCMVGTAGSGKTTAMELAEKIFRTNFPDQFVSESIQSREHLLKQMSSDGCIQTWKDIEGYLGEPGRIYDFRPFYCIVDELSNFVSVDKANMLGTLVGIYSRSYFSTGFKNDPNQKQGFPNPYVSLLACTVPDWMMNNLRIDIFTGGLGRRLVIVHCRKTELIAHPEVPKGGVDAYHRCVEHLQRVRAGYGPLKRTPEAIAWWDKWYYDKGRFDREDPILMQFHETKHIQLLKVASLLCLGEPELDRIIHVHHMENALELLTSLEKDVKRLTSGVGRNELAGVGAQILDFLERMGGSASEIYLKKYFARYLRDPEFLEVLQHYVDTEELIVAGEPAVPGKPPRRFYFTPDGYQLYLAKKAAGGSPASPSPAPR